MSPFGILRAIASLVLGVVVFFAFLGLLSLSTLHGKFLNDEFYDKHLAENNVYTRFYNQVLLEDPDIQDTTRELLGNVDIPREDVVEVTKDILPPEYLQSQVEGAVEDITDYLKKDTDTPQVFIDLSTPLDNVKPAILKYIDRRIDEMDEVPITTLEELDREVESLFRTLEMGQIPSQVPSVEDPRAIVDAFIDQEIDNLQEVPITTPEEFTEYMDQAYRQLIAGEIPATIPSIDAIPVHLRGLAYDQAVQEIRQDPSVPEEITANLDEQEADIKSQLAVGDTKSALKIASQPLTTLAIDEFLDGAIDTIVNDPSIPQEARQGLEEVEEDIKGLLTAGKIKEGLKLGAHALAGPLIDSGIDEIRAELDGEDRLDLVKLAAEENGQTVEEFLEDLEPVREALNASPVGRGIAIAVIIIAAILMGLVFLPRLASSLRWPGVTLLVTGLVFLIIGLVFRSILPGRFDGLVVTTDPEALIPPSIVNIGSDVFILMASDVASGVITPSIVVLVIGVVLLALSFLVRLFRIPFISS